MAVAIKKSKDSIATPNIRRLGYLSAAPRVSTNKDSEASGPRAHVLGVTQAFETLGWAVSPYIVGDRMPQALMAQSESKLERSSIIRLAADIVRLVMGSWHSLQAWRELSGKVDWVYERFAVLQALGWVFQSQNVPWILETNGLNFYEATIERKSIVLYGVARVLEIWAYRRCDVLICITEALKELIVEKAGISPEKILVVPNGVDIARFDPSQYSMKRLFDGPTLGFVGALVYWHRLDMLLIALKEVINEGINFNLVVIGDGPMRKNWEDRALELGLIDHIRFVGRVSWDEVPAYLSASDLGYIGNNPLEIGVMYHSPLKLYEYMAMALPVIASAHADARDMILEGRNGYLFKSGDINDLKRALRLAFRDQSRWHEMGMTARERVVKQASWLARIQTMIAGIERILKEQSANQSARR